MPPLYHSTKTLERAQSIVDNGLTKGRWGLRWVSNEPLSDFGRFVVEFDVNLTTEEIFAFEVLDSDQTFGFREFGFPEEVINRFPRRLLNPDEVMEFDTQNVWNEYPLGEPDRTITSLRDDEANDPLD